jgi:alpha-glucosidase (family GH31 glycosyl hydrolase)
MLPRFALGNWWSRYYAYTQDEYIRLMSRFREEDLPFSVAVIDMDWHLTKLEERFGRGWTGYTWNEELFPDHRLFLRWLHDNNLKVTLNLHPADGVKAHEKMYLPMAKTLGINWEKEDPIPFDIASREFIAAYFEYLHHPLEDEGVDFWWIDWQSGTLSKAEGFDPLWILNHYHSLDSTRQGKRPLIFSRYSGPGSHRYPVGFSGDTYITWASLDFQPYFTAAAANIGYAFWSHDIGGHMGGVKDEELMVRWIQFGVFSPINRLHSSNSPFMFKEPWNYGMEAEKAMGIFLRFRHALIPYLYTMCYRCTTELKALIEPLYYSHPEENEAYAHKNEYWLGSELLVAVITKKASAETRKAYTDAWLPEGSWTDFFSGMVYRGGKTVRLWRGLLEAPVFVREGGILVLAGGEAKRNDPGNPREAHILVCPTGSGTFTLYEDEGEGDAWREGRCAETRVSFEKQAPKSILRVQVRGDISFLPERRSYRILFRGVRPPRESAAALAIGKERVEIPGFYRRENRTLEFTIPAMERGGDFTLEVPIMESAGSSFELEERLVKLLGELQIAFDLKDAIYREIKRPGKLNGEDPKILKNLIASLHTMSLSPDVLSALIEEICA